MNQKAARAWNKRVKGFVNPDSYMFAASGRSRWPEMFRFIVARCIATIPVLIGVSLVVFLTVKIIPGDAAEVLAGPQATKDQVELIRQSLGLNRPLDVQYVMWLTGRYGEISGRSIQLDAPVTEMVFDRFTNTLVLALASALLAVAIGVPAGVLSATHQSSAVDRGSVLLALFGNSMPTFWLGLVFVFVFSLHFRLFPSNGMYSLRSPGGLPDLLWHLTLPALTLCGVPAAVLARVTRRRACWKPCMMTMCGRRARRVSQRRESSCATRWAMRYCRC